MMVNFLFSFLWKTNIFQDEHKNKNKNKKKSTEVKIYSLNVNSLRAEKGERLKKLAARVALFQPHAVLVQETKLNESIPDSQVAIPGKMQKDRFHIYLIFTLILVRLQNLPLR